VGSDDRATGAEGAAGAAAPPDEATASSRSTCVDSLAPVGGAASAFDAAGAAFAAETAGVARSCEAAAVGEGAAAADGRVVRAAGSTATTFGAAARPCRVGTLGAAVGGTETALAVRPARAGAAGSTSEPEAAELEATELDATEPDRTEPDPTELETVSPVVPTEAVAEVAVGGTVDAGRD
jgi:hypothetical protein